MARLLLDPVRRRPRAGDRQWNEANSPQLRRNRYPVIRCADRNAKLKRKFDTLAQSTPRPEGSGKLEPLPSLEDDGLYTPEVRDWAERKYRLISYYAEMFATSMKDKWASRV